MTHTARHAHAEIPAGLSADNLLLDIGAGAGALIIHADHERDEDEIEISPAGTGGPRTHNVVRARHAPSGIKYAAVFPALPAGSYVVWHDSTTTAGTVAITSGHVTSFVLDTAGQPDNSAG
jgi:hypothetical protein